MSASLTPSSSKAHVWIPILLVVAIGAYLLGGYNQSVRAQSPASVASAQVTGIGGTPPKGTAQNVDFQQFWDLWNLLKQKYYKQPLDDQKMMYGAMQGLAASAGDPYTVFFEPKAAQKFNDSLAGQFDGIGAEIGIKDDQLEVIAPLPDTPAAKAGVLAGDAILGINSSSTDGMSVEQAVSLIRGPKGTSVTLNIGRISKTKDAAGKEKSSVKRMDIAIQRDTITVKSVNVKFLRDGVAMIQITGFNEDTTVGFENAVNQVLAKDPKGLILDLRNDPGGFLDRATAVAGEWVGDGLVVSERRQGKIVDEYHGTTTGRLKNIPTIVLVNEGSASASEIVAGALQDDGFAKLIGTKTFGKGSVQEYSDLKNGSAVKITVAEWLTPKGRSINGKGIEPDVMVDRTEDDYHADRDPQLDKALELLTGTASTTTSATTTSR